MAKLIVIDGLDGCGKDTQTELLGHELTKMGKKVVKIDFPNYASDSSAPVRMYLNGQLGKNPELLNPYMCSSLYAVDRFIQYVTEWKKYFEEDDNTFILADRYLSSNIIHQGGKIKNDIERQNFNKWVYDYECSKCGLPKEDITIILTVKPETSQKLITERYNGNESNKDIHESNLGYLIDCYNRIQSSIDNITREGEHTWVHIQCCESNGCIDSREVIHNKVLDSIKHLL